MFSHPRLPSDNFDRLRTQQDNQEEKRNFKKSCKVRPFCGKECTALRVHKGAESANRGNFLSLLKFRADAGETTLRNHLAICRANARYSSKNNTD